MYQTPEAKLLYDIKVGQMMTAGISKDNASKATPIAELKRQETFGYAVTPEQLLEEQKQRLMPSSEEMAAKNINALLSSDIVEELRGKYTYEELIEMFQNYFA